MPVPAELGAMNNLLGEVFQALNEVKADLDAGNTFDEAKARACQEKLREVTRLKYKIMEGFPGLKRLTFLETYRLLKFIDDLIDQSETIILFGTESSEPQRRQLAKQLVEVAIKETEFLQSKLPTGGGATPEGFPSLKRVLETILKDLDSPTTAEKKDKIVKKLEELLVRKLMGASEVEYQYYGKSLDWWYKCWSEIDDSADPGKIEWLFVEGLAEYYRPRNLDLLLSLVGIANVATLALESVFQE